MFIWYQKNLSDIQSFHCIMMLIGELKVSFSIVLHTHQQGSLTIPNKSQGLSVNYST